LYSVVLLSLTAKGILGITLVVFLGVAAFLSGIPQNRTFIFSSKTLWLDKYIILLFFKEATILSKFPE
jgi:hypothetical protein